MRILLVEDEPLLGRRLQKGLSEEAFAVDLAETLEEAETREAEADYDLVILDLMLPDGSGLDLLDRWRADGMPAPVLILTARDRLEDKLEGFDTGADDYLTKPFSFEELLARVRSLLRRRTAPPADVLERGGLRLDRTGHSVSWRGRLVDLTSKEFGLLEHFMLHANRVQGRLQIAEHVWDASYEARSNVIDVMIGRVRRKLESAGAPRLIHAVKGLGYVFRESEDGA